MATTNILNPRTLGRRPGMLLLALSTDSKPAIDNGGFAGETDTGNEYIYLGDYYLTRQGGALVVAGPESERGQGTSNNYILSNSRANVTIINKQTAATIGAGAANDTYLISVEFVKALVGTCVIAGFVDDAGSAASITYPAATAAGVKEFGHAINSAGALTVTCSNASDALQVIVRWRPV